MGQAALKAGTLQNRFGREILGEGRRGNLAWNALRDGRISIK